MKKSLKKMLAVACLGFVGFSTLSGCSMSREQKEAIDKAVNKADEILQLIDKKNKEYTKEEIHNKLKEKIFNQSKLLATQNLTYMHKEGNKIISKTRIEYVSDELIKLYIYSTDDQGVITEEVYKEITPDSVTTYLKSKDFKLYSVISMLNCIGTPLSFYKSIDRFENGNGGVWEVIINKYNLDKTTEDKVYFEKESNIIESLCEKYTLINNLDIDEFTNEAVAEYDYENDKINLSVLDCDYLTYKYQYFKEDMHISNDAIISECTSIINDAREVEISQKVSEKSYIFDKVNENKIDFDKTGFTLATDYFYGS